MNQILAQNKASPPGRREARLRLGLGPLARGQDGDDHGLAADRADLGEHLAARQGVLVPAQVEDRRQGRLRARARLERRARGRLHQGRDGHVGEPGGRVPLQPVGDEPVGLAPARDAALHAARPVPDLALPLAGVQEAVAGRRRVPGDALRGGERRRARPLHERRRRLRERARPGDDRDLRGQGRPGRRSTRPPRSGTDHATSSAWRSSAPRTRTSSSTRARRARTPCRKRGQAVKC